MILEALPAERSLEEIIEFLRSVNPLGSEYRNRLEKLIEQGMSGPDLLRCTNHLGWIEHSDPDDKNAAHKRFHLTPHSALEAGNKARAQYSWLGYGPYIEAIERTRRLIFEIAIPNALSEMQEMVPANEKQRRRFLKMNYPVIAGIIERTSDAIYEDIFTAPQEPVSRPETMHSYEEFMSYFASFEENPPDLDSDEIYVASNWPVLRQIMKQIAFIEITKGCSGPCASICAAVMKSKPQAHIPFKILEWMLRTFKDELQHSTWVPYYASDPQDYRDGDKTGADVYQLIYDELGIVPYTSTYYSTDQGALDFLHDLVVVKGLSIGRISCLASGLEEDAADKLIEAMRRQSGEALTNEHEQTIRAAVELGKKGNAEAKVYGNAIRNGMQNAQLSNEQVSCSHGLTLTCSGLRAHIYYPNSKLFPYELTYPVRWDSETEELRIPRNQYKDAYQYPLITQGKMIYSYYQRARIMTIARNGRVGEEHAIQLSPMNAILQHYLTGLKEVDNYFYSHVDPYVKRNQFAVIESITNIESFCKYFPQFIDLFVNTFVDLTVHLESITWTELHENDKQDLTMILHSFGIYTHCFNVLLSAFHKLVEIYQANNEKERMEGLPKTLFHALNTLKRHFQALQILYEDIFPELEAIQQNLVRDIRASTDFPDEIWDSILIGHPLEPFPELKLPW